MKNFKFYFKNKKKKGIALLFAVMLSSILLVVALSISNIATKEAAFSISARNANDAFYAADSGSECALISDKGANSVFTDPITVNDLPCAGSGTLEHPASDEWMFTVSSLGSAQSSCAKVTVTKTTDGEGVTLTTVVSKGYNKTAPGGCGVNTSNIVGRELQVIY